jgi:WS/DGAT/MGAT family acyltransferase
VTHPIRLLTEFSKLTEAIGTLATPRTLAPRSSLNVQITAARSVEFVRLSFAEIDGVAHTFDTTINDVLLTIVTGGLHRLFESRGELAEKSELQALVPVGLENVSGGLANTLSALFVRLPIAATDPLEILSTVSAEVKADKRRHQSMAAATLLRLLDPFPQSVLALVAGIVQHQPFFNVIVTNVPGPPVPLYALGARLLAAFPIVPLAGNQSVSVAALSYGGQLNLGVLSDPTSCPDVAIFCAGVRSTLQSLVDQSGSHQGSS